MYGDIRIPRTELENMIHIQIQAKMIYIKRDGDSIRGGLLAFGFLMEVRILKRRVLFWHHSHDCWILSVIISRVRTQTRYKPKFVQCYINFIKMCV